MSMRSQIYEWNGFTGEANAAQKCVTIGFNSSNDCMLMTVSLLCGSHQRLCFMRGLLSYIDVTNVSELKLCFRLLALVNVVMVSRLSDV